MPGKYEIVFSQCFQGFLLSPALPESGLAITSSAAPVDGGGAHGRKRIGVSSVASPSPRPSPLGEGESLAALSPIQSASSRRGAGCGVPSPSGRARVRGNETQPTKTAGRILQVQLDRLLKGQAPSPFAL